jgi:hypothetical protein
MIFKIVFMYKIYVKMEHKILYIYLNEIHIIEKLVEK